MALCATVHWCHVTPLSPTVQCRCSTLNPTTHINHYPLRKYPQSFLFPYHPQGAIKDGVMIPGLSGLQSRGLQPEGCRLFCFLKVAPIWEFLNIRGIILGFPIKRTIVFGGLYWGTLILRYYNIAQIFLTLCSLRGLRESPSKQP